MMNRRHTVKQGIKTKILLPPYITVSNHGGCFSLFFSLSLDPLCVYVFDHHSISLFRMWTADRVALARNEYVSSGCIATAHSKLFSFAL